MDLQKLSKKWHDEATSLLADSKIEQLLAEFGEVTITGSYNYDLMLGADIDLFIRTESPSRELAEEITVRLTRGGYWNSIMFCDWMALPTFKQDEHPELPAGHYFCVKKEFEGTRWKIDIFLVDPDEFQRRMNIRAHYKNVTDEQKLVILSLKDARNNGALRPDISSAIFYDAAIAGVKTVDDFKNTLKD